MSKQLVLQAQTYLVNVGEQKMVFFVQKSSFWYNNYLNASFLLSDSPSVLNDFQNKDSF